MLGIFKDKLNVRPTLLKVSGGKVPAWQKDGEFGTSKWKDLKHRIEEPSKFDRQIALGSDYDGFVGILSSVRNLYCLDIDDCCDYSHIVNILQILQLPSDYQGVVRSGSQKGYHIYIETADKNKLRAAMNQYNSLGKMSPEVRTFAPDPDSSIGLEFKQMEVRMVGVIVLPTSKHKSGNTYEWYNSTPTSFSTVEDNLIINLIENFFLTNDLGDERRYLKGSANVADKFSQRYNQFDDKININTLLDQYPDFREALNLSGEREIEPNGDIRWLGGGGFLVTEDGTKYIRFTDSSGGHWQNFLKLVLPSDKEPYTWACLEYLDEPDLLKFPKFVKVTDQKGVNKVSISAHNVGLALGRVGYGLLLEDEGEYILTRSSNKNRVLEIVTPETMQTDALLELKSILPMLGYDHGLIEMIQDTLTEYLGSKYKVIHHAIPRFKLKPYQKDTKEAIIFTKDKVLQVTTHGFKEGSYDDVISKGYYIWKESIMDIKLPDVSELPTPDKFNFSFSRFCDKILDNYNRDLYFRAVGNVLVGSPEVGSNKLILFTENVDGNNESSGGTGKGLLSRGAFDFMKIKNSWMDGKTINMRGDGFALQNINKGDKLTLIEDLSEDFRISSIYNLTDKIPVRKLHKSTFILEGTERPIIFLNTNFIPPDMQEESSLRRLVNINLNKVYGADYTPMDDPDVGMMFDNSWNDKEQMALFVLSCAKYFIDHDMSYVVDVNKMRKDAATRFTNLTSAMYVDEVWDVAKDIRDDEENIMRISSQLICETFEKFYNEKSAKMSRKMRNHIEQFLRVKKIDGEIISFEYKKYSIMKNKIWGYVIELPKNK